MSHFTSGVYAKVHHTYAHAYGGSNVDSYCLVIQAGRNGWSEVAWYYENQLELVTDQEIIKTLEESIKVYDDLKKVKEL